MFGSVNLIQRIGEAVPSARACAKLTRRRLSCLVTGWIWVHSPSRGLSVMSSWMSVLHGFNVGVPVTIKAHRLDLDSSCHNRLNICRSTHCAGSDLTVGNPDVLPYRSLQNVVQSGRSRMDKGPTGTGMPHDILSADVREAAKCQ